MSKRFLFLHNAMQFAMLIEFASLFVLALITVVANFFILRLLLAILICVLGITTAVFFVLTMIYLTKFINDQIELFFKKYEQQLKDANNNRN